MRFTVTIFPGWALRLRRKCRVSTKLRWMTSLTMTFPVDPRIKDKVQSEVKTTASALPLVVNDTVLGYINYFSGTRAQDDRSRSGAGGQVPAQ